jgi:nitroimidazol reductase NimA-like FMN-containing flavoprotein (pyridoxamine 5'-phosphate oxidase superfamily)
MKTFAQFVKTKEDHEETNEKVNIELEEWDDGAFEVSSEYLTVLVQGKVAQITADRGNAHQFEMSSKDLKEICKKLLSKM